MHQLHCVDFIRQGLYYNHEYYRNIHSIAWVENQSAALKQHLAHCVDLMRQLVICEADNRVTGYLKSGPPDFATTKQCRNFEAVRDFAVEHQWAKADHYTDIDDRHRGYRTATTPRLSRDQIWRGH
jgi:hypothetical protein